ncbi:hypothetical protein C8Q77DRAFT_132514 [Trametes polyzona]|nr:hypothetical protein C8Q77DRAFT_132514 [Trametes polyzona]
MSISHSIRDDALPAPIDELCSQIESCRVGTANNAVTRIDAAAHIIPPVNRLPLEVIVQIFDALRPPPVIGEYEYNNERHAWTRPRLVCRYWDAVIRATSLFWAEVHVRTHPSWLRLCLSRSNGAPLDVAFYDNTCVPGGLTTLARHAARIRSLAFRCGTRTSLQYWVRLLERHALCPVSLEVFEVTPGFGVELGFEFPCSPLYPQLHSLYITRARIPSRLHLLPNLRHLALKDASAGEGFTVDDFLQALASCPHLESLSIINSLDAPGGSWDLSSSQRYPVELRSLKSLELCDSDEYTFILKVAFLNLIRFPIAVRVLLGNVLPEGWGEDLPEDIRTRLSALLPPPPTCDAVFPALKTIASVDVQLGAPGNQYEMHAQSTLGSKPDSAAIGDGAVFDLSLFHPPEMLDPWPEDVLDQIALDLTTVFGRSPLTRLCLECSVLRETPDADLWTGVLRAFPTLEVLIVRQSRDFLGLWEVLHAGLAPSPQGDKNGARPRSPASSDMLCPRLDIVEWAGSSDSDLGAHAPIGEMLECLSLRRKHGSRLRRLDVSRVETYAFQERRDWWWSLRARVLTGDHIRYDITEDSARTRATGLPSR